MPFFSPIVLAAGALAAGGAALGYTISSGESAKKAQEQALRQQTQAQQEQATMAAAQQERSMTAMRRTQMRQPDVSGIMAGAQEIAEGGPTSTMLTGPMGVNPQDLNLGRSTLLGG
jgi:Flp pilus assembly protein TadB